jgi:hypothetical protein
MKHPEFRIMGLMRLSLPEIQTICYTVPKGEQPNFRQELTIAPVSGILPPQPLMQKMQADALFNSSVFISSQWYVGLQFAKFSNELHGQLVFT